MKKIKYLAIVFASLLVSTSCSIIDKNLEKKETKLETTKENKDLWIDKSNKIINENVKKKALEFTDAALKEIFELKSKERLYEEDMKILPSNLRTQAIATFNTYSTGFTMTGEKVVDTLSEKDIDDIEYIDDKNFLLDLDFKYKTQDNYGKVINIDDGDLKVKFTFEDNTLTVKSFIFD